MARQKHMSKARTWEYRIKDAIWGFDEAEFSLLPRVLRELVWQEAMLQGPKCNDPSPETLAMCEAHLALGEDDPAEMEAVYEIQNGETILAGWVQAQS
jgi:hypothetical protein